LYCTGWSAHGGPVKADTRHKSLSLSLSLSLFPSNAATHFLENRRCLATDYIWTSTSESLSVPAPPSCTLWLRPLCPRIIAARPRTGTSPGFRCRPHLRDRGSERAERGGVGEERARESCIRRVRGHSARTHRQGTKRPRSGGRRKERYRAGEKEKTTF